MQNPVGLAALPVLPGITGPSSASLVNIDLVPYDSSDIKKFMHIKDRFKNVSLLYLVLCANIVTLCFLN